jgi:hypothetical protein
MGALKKMKFNGKKVAVCGGGRFIGGLLVKYVWANGVSSARSIDVKPLDEW